MNPISSQIATGSFAAVWVRISAHSVSSSPTVENTANSGIASATTGIIRMISSSARMSSCRATEAAPSHKRTEAPGRSRHHRHERNDDRVPQIAGQSILTEDMDKLARSDGLGKDMHRRRRRGRPSSAATVRNSQTSGKIVRMIVPAAPRTARGHTELDRPTASLERHPTCGCASAWPLTPVSHFAHSRGAPYSTARNRRERTNAM